MLRPFILIGVGGSGGKTLRIVRYELQRRLTEIGWTDTFPSCWQFLHIDVPSVADGDDPDLPPQLANADYAGLITAGVSYRNVDTALAGTGRTDPGDAIAGWRPTADQVNVPVERGAGQFRALGRVITLANLRTAKARLDEALRNINGRDVTAQLMRLTELSGGKPSSIVKQPVAVVVSSIAGGSGAGAVIDVCDLLRASGSGTWPGQSMGILYCPDVFDYLDPARRRGVRPNALATLSELMAGYWNKQGPSTATADILNRQGVVLGDIDRLGPRYSFLVGAKNEFVTYRTQNDVYAAMGRSMASWMTSTVLQDRMDAYVVGNWTSSAGAVPDKLNLKLNGMETPFTALGSARVGLGRDRFRDYAAQRLARAAVDQLLDRHESTRRRGDERPGRSIAQELADQRFAAFLSDSGLNERTQSANDILDALRPAARQDELRGLTSQILRQVQENTPAKGQSAATWRDRIAQRIHETIDRTLDEFDVEHREQGRAWLGELQRDLRALAARTIAMEGLVTAGILFRKLAEELRVVRTELEQEVSSHARFGENVVSLIDRALETGSNTLLPAEHESVENAVRQGVSAIWYRSEARLRQLVVGILPDLSQNLVERLAEEIERAQQALRDQRDPSNGQRSTVRAWPDGDEVPTVLMPAANEFLLEEPASYGARLVDIVMRTTQVEDRKGAMDRAVGQVIMGCTLDELSQQVVVEQPALWTPKDHELHLELATPQRAAFTIVSGAEAILVRATQWLTKPGTPAGNYVREGLHAYFDADKVEPAERTKRLAKFEQQFAASVDTAQPLVGIKKDVLIAVHERTDVQSETFFTELPVASGSEEGVVIRRVLESKGMWNQETAKAFTIGDRDFIDSFTVLSEPYEPVVFDSLMKPIAEEWGDRSKNADGREEFWRWRRSRELPEFVPVAPAVRKAMVRGWFTATILGQIEMRDLNVRIFVPNPVGGDGRWVPFPDPLLASGIQAQHDYLPLALESLPLALVDVSRVGDIQPVAAYSRLRELGTGGDGGLDAYRAPYSELKDWVVDGTLPKGAPLPRPEHAGTPGDEFKIRRDAVSQRATALLGSYSALFESVEQRNEQNVPRAYELRVDIRASLDEVRRAVGDLQGAAEDQSWN